MIWSINSDQRNEGYRKGGVGGMMGVWPEAEIGWRNGANEPALEDGSRSRVTSALVALTPISSIRRRCDRAGRTRVWEEVSDVGTEACGRGVSDASGVSECRRGRHRSLRDRGGGSRRSQSE